MRRTWLPIAALGAVIAVAGLVGALTLRDDDSETASAASPGPARVAHLSYAAKFICGLQKGLPAGQIGEPPVKAGNYATEINIHNPNYVGIDATTANLRIHKKLVILVGTNARTQKEFAFREPELAKPSKFVTLDLPPDTATMDDCQAVWRMAKQVGGPIAPGAFTIGYLVIMSRAQLDVDVVYTSSVSGADLTGGKATGIAIDVERVEPKRVPVPPGVLQ